jgi:dTDP-6-deoxy-L-talose 4-dehydrogenase (NAD+)
MKVLVTGATGFIGNYVIQELLRYDKYKIIANSRNKEKAKSFDWYNKVEYINWDLNKKEENYFDFFKNPDLLMNYIILKEMYHIIIIS